MEYDFTYSHDGNAYAAVVEVRVSSEGHPANEHVDLYSLRTSFIALYREDGSEVHAPTELRDKVLADFDRYHQTDFMEAYHNEELSR